MAGWEGIVTCPLMYPSSPLDPSSCFILVDHFSRLFPLNFCSLESNVRVGMPDIVDRGNSSTGGSYSRCSQKV